MGQPFGYQPMPAPQQPVWQRPPRPTTVTVATALMMITVVLRVVGVAIGFSSRDEVRRILREREPGLSPSEVDRFANLGVDIAIAVGIAFALFYLFLAWKLSRGKNWARITTWVFCGLAILGVFAEFAQANTGLTETLGVIEGLVAVAITILLALRASNDYFRKPPPQVGYYPYPT